LSATEGRRFGLTLGGAFLVLAAVLLWRDRTVAGLVGGGLGTVILIAGFAIPRRLGPLYRAWMGLAHLLSMVTTPIFMGIIYFGVFTPVGLVRRIVGRNSIARRPNEVSYWVPRAAGSGRGDMERQF
jgi:hypothetical protein